MSGTASAVARWLHDLVCASQNGIGGCDAEDHARRTQRGPAREVMALSTPEEVARWLHHRACPAWLERSHMSIYVERSNAWCGVDGERHVAAILDGPTLPSLLTLLGMDA